MSSDRPIIFYDGVCALCNGTVKFVIRFDSKEKFSFSALDSDYASKHLKLPENIDSIVLLDKGNQFYKSDAVIRILIDIGGFGKLAYLFYMVPKPIRDFVYEFIANNRYKWFGKYDSCPVPSPEIRNRFIQ